MKLIKLTGKTGDTVYVNPEHVSSVIQDTKGTVLHVIGCSVALIVKESMHKVVNDLEGNEPIYSKAKTNTKGKSTNATKKDL